MITLKRLKGCRLRSFIEKCYLSKEDIYVAILHPGLVSTRMTGFTKNGISPEESANGLLNRIDSLNKNNSGTFWHANGEVLPW